MRSPQLCVLFLLVSLVPGLALLAGTVVLPSPDGSQENSSAQLRTHLVLRGIHSLRQPRPSGAQRSFRPAVPWQAPRERKAGCKTFYWKTLTAC